MPGAERAIVEPAKVRDYLLSTEHPVGRTKARFFAALGFTRSEWPLLEQALLDLAVRGNSERGQASPFGQKYAVRGDIQGPSGREAEVVSIWIVLVGEDVPRFVTAYPGQLE